MRFVEHSFNDCAKAEAFSARNIKMIGKLRGDCISVTQSPSPISAVTKRCFFRRGTKMDLISISFLSLLLMLPDRGEAHVIPVTANALVIVTDIPKLLELRQKNQAIRALPPSIIIEEAFKKGIEAEDDNLNTLAKKCCLSSDEVKIWVGHLHKKKETRAKAVRKTKEKGKEETNIVNIHIFFKQLKFILETMQN